MEQQNSYTMQTFLSIYVSGYIHLKPMILRFALANTKKQIQFCSICNYIMQQGYTQNSTKKVNQIQVI